MLTINHHSLFQVCHDQQLLTKGRLHPVMRVGNCSTLFTFLDTFVCMYVCMYVFYVRSQLVQLQLVQLQ